MISISLCMIVKDEEAVLGRCLDSVGKVADEIIIVDTGSEDQTKETASGYTDLIYDFPWQDDFSAARNFSLSKGTKDYLMWMDADDILPPESAEKLSRLKEELDPGTDVVMMPYVTAFDADGRAAFQYERERIVRNCGAFRFVGRVHEVIPPAGKIVHADIPVEHRKEKEPEGERNLRIYRDMEAKGEQFDSRALYYYGRELASHGVYEKGAEVLEEFLRRPDGWTENRIDATRQLAACLGGMGREEEVLSALLRALEYDIPRGETCCEVGRYFLERGNYAQAAWWYERALSAKKAAESGAFITEACYGYLPAISLCVCYDRMGDPERARMYNELAEQFRPGDPYCRANREYFWRERDLRQP